MRRFDWWISMPVAAGEVRRVLRAAIDDGLEFEVEYE
jgi:hypothetical protein